MAENKTKTESKVAKASLRRVRIAPRKARVVADLVRRMSSVEEARAQLLMSPRRASKHILKLLNSVLANAEHNYNMKSSQLKIDSITVDEGPTYKRWMPRAFGRATPKDKRTSHITITVKESEEVTSKFIIPKKEKKSDSDSGKGHSHDDDYEKPVKDLSPQQTKSKESKMKRMFRRKSV